MVPVHGRVGLGWYGNKIGQGLTTRSRSVRGRMAHFKTFDVEIRIELEQGTPELVDEQDIEAGQGHPALNALKYAEKSKKLKRPSLLKSAIGS